MLTPCIRAPSPTRTAPGPGPRSGRPRRRRATGRLALANGGRSRLVEFRRGASPTSRTSASRNQVQPSGGGGWAPAYPWLGKPLAQSKVPAVRPSPAPGGARSGGERLPAGKTVPRSNCGRPSHAVCARHGGGGGCQMANGYRRAD
jgi:hypothetical protein